MSNDFNQIIKNSNFIVIKIGSSLIVSNQTNSNTTTEIPPYIFNYKWIESIASDINDLIRLKNKKVCIVTSGAIATAKLDLLKQDNNVFQKSFSIKQKQSLAAIGQIRLMSLYHEIFAKFNLSVGQVLMSKDDIKSENRKLNIKNTIETMINDFNTIPIINENDTINFDEIKFGDNDTLSAHLSGIVSADLLIILSDIEGLYDSNPKINQKAKFIFNVDKINNNIIKMAGDSISKTGTGGMITKIQAAKICIKSKCQMILKKGTDQNPLKTNTEIFTLFSKKN